MLSNMLKHRSAAGVTVLDGEIYACGGHDGLSIFDSVSCHCKLYEPGNVISNNVEF